MKRYFLMIIFFFAAAGLTQAQEKTLLSGKIEHGGFGGPVVKFTQIDDQFGVLVGGRGGWIIDHAIVLGFGGYGLSNEVRGENTFAGFDQNLNFGYGGFEMEYIINSDELMHFTFYTLIGAGGVNYRLDADITDINWDPAVDSFFILEPAANIELNLTSFFRLNFGIGYRIVSGVEEYNLNDEALSGVSGVLNFKFGSF